MSFLAKMKAMPRYLPHGTAHGGIKGIVVDKGTRYGAAWAYGAAKGYYGERFIWKGHGLDLWTGVGALLLSAGFQAFSGGRSAFAPTLERVGDAGVMSALGSLGASWGLEKAGRVVQTLAPGKNVRRIAGDYIGHIPQAMGGAFLSADEIARFASPRR